LDNPRDRLLSARLYAITPDADPAEVVRLASGWVRGGADAVQLRHKALPRGELLELAIALQKVCHDAGVLFIVNDHVDIALLAGADGVHLGPDDLGVASARQVGGDQLLIGASASSTGAARDAATAGADYLGSGPAFATPVKAEKDVIGPAGVAAVRDAVSIPVFAIGGIDLGRVPEVRAAGLDRVCVIRGLVSPDPEATAREFRQALS